MTGQLVGQVTFTRLQWQEHQERHEAPHFGCPVCFLALADMQVYEDEVRRCAKLVLSAPDVDRDSKRYARRVLRDMEGRNARVLEHLRESEARA